MVHIGAAEPAAPSSAAGFPRGAEFAPDPPGHLVAVKPSNSKVKGKSVEMQAPRSTAHSSVVRRRAKAGNDFNGDAEPRAGRVDELVRVRAQPRVERHSNALDVADRQEHAEQVEVDHLVLHDAGEAEERAHPQFARDQNLSLPIKL